MTIREQTMQSALGKLKELAGSEKFKTIKPETQTKVLDAISRIEKEGSSVSFRESKSPSLGGIQVLPKSPISMIDRYKLGLADPAGRKQILNKLHGKSFGAQGREFVVTQKGFQSVNPRGFDMGDIAEFGSDAPSIIGQVGGSVGGGIIGAMKGTPVRGAGIGAFIGTTVGEMQERILGKTLGVRLGTPWLDEIKGAFAEGAKAGAYEMAFAGGARAMPGLGKFMGKTGRGAEEILRKVGKAKKSTVDWLKSRVSSVGAKEVFNPDKTVPTYASRTLLPRLKEGVTTMFKNFTDDSVKFFKRFNLSDDAVRSLKNEGYDDILATQKRLGNSTADISNKLQTTLQHNLDEASRSFDSVLRQQPEFASIGKANFQKAMRGEFKRKGFMNPNNSWRQGVDWKNAPTQIKRLRGVYDELAEIKSMRVSDYFRYSDIMDDAVSGKGGADISIFKAKEALRGEAVESVKGLKVANKVYSKAKQMADDFLPEKYTGEKALEKWGKMTSKERARLMALDKDIPFLDDLRKLHVARELDTISNKTFDPAKIESMFSAGASESKTVASDALKVLDDALPSQHKFFNDLNDWYAHMDLQDVGAYTSNAGITRSLAEASVGQYYKSVYPFLRKTGAVGRKVLGPVGRGLQRGIKGVTEPTIKGITLRPGAVALREYQKNR